jgi:hypothetical protein
VNKQIQQLVPEFRQSEHEPQKPDPRRVHAPTTPRRVEVQKSARRTEKPPMGSGRETNVTKEQYML